MRSRLQKRLHAGGGALARRNQKGDGGTVELPVGQQANMPQCHVLIVFADADACMRQQIAGHLGHPVRVNCWSSRWKVSGFGSFSSA